jgi:hypothetical protein
MSARSNNNKRKAFFSLFNSDPATAMNSLRGKPSDSLQNSERGRVESFTRAVVSQLKSIELLLSDVGRQFKNSRFAIMPSISVDKLNAILIARRDMDFPTI